MASKVSFPWGTITTKKGSVSTTKSPIIYYGGKSRDKEWIVNNLPANWNTSVELFGGGGSYTFYLASFLQHVSGDMKKTLVYNDIGNVANFMRMLRDYGDELFKRIYLTPWSREDFDESRGWPKQLEKALLSGQVEDYIEWARLWYAHIMLGFTHEERPGSTGFKVSKTINAAKTFHDRVDELPYFIDLLRSGITVEKGDYSRMIDTYDSVSTLFYVDPPYTEDSRTSSDNYMNELPEREQIILLQTLDNVKGQVVLSGYHNYMYDKLLYNWRVIEKTAVSGIANSKQERGTRTEVLWVKEHGHGLWEAGSKGTSPNVPGIQV